MKWRLATDRTTVDANHSGESNVIRIASATLALALAATLAPADADAQYGSGQGGGARGSPGTGQVGGSHLPPSRNAQDARAADGPVSLGGQVQVNLDRLGEDLRINAAQQMLWDAYATRVIRLADDVSRARFAAREPQVENMTAPQLFDRATEIVQNRLTAVEEIVEAGRALYARLSTEQQRIADRRLAAVAVSLASGMPPPGARTDDGPSPGAKARAP